MPIDPTTGNQIIDYIEKNQQATAHELAEVFSFSRQTIHKRLKQLVEAGSLQKVGAPPKVYYRLKNGALITENTAIYLLDDAWKNTIENRFLNITPSGEKQEGFAGFIAWCKKRNLPIEKTADEYIDTLKKYDVYRNDSGVINGLEKLRSTFKAVYLDELFYLDFYSIERFGKTKLGQFLLYAKQSQNKELIQEILQMIYPRVRVLVRKKNIEAVGFIPPTIKRDVQLMTEIQKGLAIDLPIISLTKVISDIAVPQKSLSKIEDRIENAQKTILVTENKVYKNILLIDDAVGSGATLNETAKKIRDKGLCTGKIIGLALTGSFNGFDVVNEV